MRPLLDKIIVEALEEEETTAGGIVVPDAIRGKVRGATAHSKVIATGEGNFAKDGTPMGMNVKVGDIVYFTMSSYGEIEIKDKKYGLIHYTSVIAILDDGEY